MATGEIRATMALTEPGGGSDLQAMRTMARREGDEYVVNGAKTWITNSRRCGLIALLCKTDPDRRPRTPGHLHPAGRARARAHRLTRPAQARLQGRGELRVVFEDYRAPAEALLGGREGQGFAQMMKRPGDRTPPGRRAVRSASAGRRSRTRSRYAQERESFGKPIWQHQSIGNYLADMATELTAARQLMPVRRRARPTPATACDMEAGMAKLFASETAMEIALNAVRIHGGYGYSTEFDVERYFRDAPLMIVGEGTNEIQRNVIASQLISRGGL